MKIVAISGSSSEESSNYQLLLAIKRLFADEHEVLVYNHIHTFELFTVQKASQALPANITAFKELLTEADAFIIATPEYAHNIPAVLKNMLEWCTHSGEFSEKPVLPIVFTPHEPRGEDAMTALVNTLSKGLKAKVITEFPLYKTDVEIENGTIILPEDIQSILKEVISLM